MNIKTITCHNVYNYGASLQEYALIEYLRQNGHEVAAINYTPSYLSNNFKLLTVAHPFFSKYYFTKLVYILLKLPKRLRNRKRKINFDKFSANFIPSTNKNFQNNLELKQELPEAEAFICGSDQIWNSFFENGKDPAFYLDFVPDDILKISYAASFALDRLEDHIQPFVKQLVSRLNFVSVRETSGVTILNSLGINNVEQVLDPVFLLDKLHWEKISESKTKHKKYVFVYDFDYNPAIQNLAEKLRDTKGYEIITVNELNKYADKNYFLEGPQLFLNLIKNADFIIANSFHAVAFSIIFQKEVIVFNRNESINTRMRDLLNLFEIKDRIFEFNSSVNPASLEEINYLKVQELVTQHIISSKMFLLNSLADYFK